MADGVLELSSAAQADPNHFTPWSRDAQAYVGRHPVDWVMRLFLVEAPGIRAFDTAAKVVAAPRGHGKSAVMHRLAAKYKSDDGYVLLRAIAPYFNELSNGPIATPDAEGDRRALLSAVKWEQIWLATFLAFFAASALRARKVHQLAPPSRKDAQEALGADDAALAAADREVARAGRRISEPTDETLASGLLRLAWSGLTNPNREFIGPFVNAMVNRWDDRVAVKDPGTHKVWGSAYGALEPAIVVLADLLGAFGDPQKHYVALVDAVDEAFVHWVQAEDGSKVACGLRERPFEDSAAVWIAAQKGLLFACSTLKRYAANASIKATMRAEAIAALDARDLPRLGDRASKFKDSAYTQLRYEASHLRAVFDANVRLSPQDWAEPKATNTVKKLFGFDKVWHSTVFGKTEDLFSLILRHTFGTPRDLVSLVRSALDVVIPAQRKGDAPIVLDALDLAAAELCVDWLGSIFPSLQPAALQVLPLLSTNLYSAREMQVLEEQVEVDGLFDELIRAGLAGFPVEFNGQHRLRFLDATAHDRTLPVAPSFCALHPALSALLSRQRRTDCPPLLRLPLPAQTPLQPFEYSSRFIVGQGAPCPEELTPVQLILDHQHWSLTGVTSQGPIVVDLLTAPAGSTSGSETVDLARRTIATVLLGAVAMDAGGACLVDLEMLGRSSLGHEGCLGRMDLGIGDYEVKGKPTDRPRKRGRTLLPYLFESGLDQNSAIKRVMKDWLDPLGLSISVREGKLLGLKWHRHPSGERSRPVLIRELLIKGRHQRHIDIGGPVCS